MAREDGQDRVEYGLLLTPIKGAAISGSHKVATAIETILANIGTSLS